MELYIRAMALTAESSDSGIEVALGGIVILGNVYPIYNSYGETTFTTVG